MISQISLFLYCLFLVLAVIAKFLFLLVIYAGPTLLFLYFVGIPVGKILVRLADKYLIWEH